MSAQEKAQQAIDLLREAVAEIADADSSLSGFAVMKVLGVDKAGVGISLDKLLGRVPAAIAQLPRRDCC